MVARMKLQARIVLVLLAIGCSSKDPAEDVITDACSTCTTSDAQPDAPPPRGWRATKLDFNSMRAMWVAPTGDIYVGGESSFMHRRTPDGVWHEETSPFKGNSPSESVTEIWGTSANDIFALGREGNIGHSTGDGTWTEFPRTTVNGCDYLDGLWGSGPDDVYFAGAYPSGPPCVLHWDGQNLTNRSPPFALGSAHSVWGTGPNDVWVAASGAIMFHRDASGTWTQYIDDDTHTSGELTTIWGSGPNNIYVGGTDGRLIRWNGGSWTALPNVSVGTPNVVKIWGSSAQDIYLVTDVALYHSTGGAFTQISTTVPFLYDLWGKSASDVFVLGTGDSSWNYLFDGP